MAHKEDEIADKFNQIFQLEFNWSDDSVLREAAAGDVAEFVKLVEELLPEIQITEVQNAIWTLTQNKSLLPLALQDEKFMRSLNVAHEERMAIEKSLHPVHMNDLVFLRKGRDLEDGSFTSLNEADVRLLLELFYPVESELLHEAGLNQSSVSVILSKLKRSEESVARNLLHSRSVLTGKYIEATNVLSRCVGSLRETLEARKYRIQIASPMNLVRAKEKIIGLATLWGNAVPLLVSKDWGIASVISATAGATVAAVLPSGQKEKSSAIRKGRGAKKSPSRSG